MSNKGSYYKAPWDEEAKRKTKLYFMILLPFFIFSMFGFAFGMNTKFMLVVIIIWVSIFAFLINALRWYFVSPTGYIIQNSSIIIEREVGIKKIEFSEIQEVKYIQGEIKIKIGQAGSRSIARHQFDMGWIGYSGDVFTEDYGKVHSYCNRWSDFIMIIMKHYNPYLLAPDDPRLFIDELSFFNKSSPRHLNRLDFKFNVEVSEKDHRKDASLKGRNMPKRRGSPPDARRRKGETTRRRDESPHHTGRRRRIPQRRRGNYDGRRRRPPRPHRSDHEDSSTFLR